MKLAIIKYNGGNIQSVLFALERLGVKGTVTDNHEKIRSADKIIFPGVGEASTVMASLQQLGLDKLIPGLHQPVLGICLGMQLLCKHSEENNTTCLGIFDTNVRLFASSPKIEGGGGVRYKTPHIGWNDSNGAYYYFVHSYYAEVSNETTATTEYGIPFSSALSKNNFHGVQFHPEKSGRNGEQYLKNFLSLK